MDHPEKKSKENRLLPLLLIGAGGLILLWAFMGGAGGSSLSLKDPEVQNRINQHLSKTSEAIEMRKTGMVIQNTKSALEYSKSRPGVAVSAPSEGSDLREDFRADMVAEDLGRTSPQDNLGQHSSATDAIQSQVFEQEIQQMEDAAYKAEYARQFVENAKKAGWDVLLDENYQVISVKKGRNPSQTGSGFRLFDGRGSGSN